VREGLGDHGALRTPLQRVVANLRGRIERLFDIALLEDLVAIAGSLWVVSRF